MDPIRSLEPDKVINERDVEILSVRWSPDDSHIAAGCSDGSVKIYSTISGSIIRSMSTKLINAVFPITSIRWRPERATGKTKNVILATTCDGFVIHWHTSSGKTLNSFKIEENQALSSDYNSDGSNFAVGCKDRSVKIFDEGTKEIVADLNGGDCRHLGHDNRIMSVKWIDSSILVSGGWDNNILIWDVRSGQSIRSFYGPRIYGDSLDIKGDQLLAGSYNIEEQLQIWSLFEGKCVFSQNLTGEKSCMPYTAQFSRYDNGNVFAVGGIGSTQCYFFNTQERTQFAALNGFPKAVYSVDFAYHSDRVVVGGGDGPLRVFRYANRAESLDLDV